MTSASYALVRVKNVAAAKAWLRSAPVTTAVAVKAAAENCPATSRSRRLASKRLACRSQSLPAFHMSFAEAWGKKAARDNWVTLEKTPQQIGIGAAPEASHMRW